MHSIGKEVIANLQTDRPGMLAKAAEAIAQAGINIEGYAEVEGIFHVLTKNVTGTRRALESAGFPVQGEREVLVVEVQDRPGVTANILRRIADAGVNVNFSYVAANNRLVIAADNVQKAAEALTKEDAKAART